MVRWLLWDCSLVKVTVISVGGDWAHTIPVYYFKGLSPVMVVFTARNSSHGVVIEQEYNPCLESLWNN